LACQKTTFSEHPFADTIYFKMDIWVHTIVSIIIELLLWPFFGVWAILVFVGGVLIDVDHVIWYFSKTGKFNLKKNYDHCQDIARRKDVKSYKSATMIFHTFDVLLLVVLLTLIYPNLAPLLIGLVAHLLMDHFYVSANWGKPHFIHLFKKSSLIFLYKSVKKHIF